MTFTCWYLSDPTWSVTDEASDPERVWSVLEVRVLRTICIMGEHSKYSEILSHQSLTTAWSTLFPVINDLLRYGQSLWVQILHRMTPHTTLIISHWSHTSIIIFVILTIMNSYWRLYSHYCHTYTKAFSPGKCFLICIQSLGIPSLFLTLHLYACEGHQ